MRSRVDTSVFVVVLDAAGAAVLLCRREDFRVWGLPGGRVESGEKPDAAGVREAHEETGYRVTIDRMVGEYVMPPLLHRGHVSYVYAGRVVGGAPLGRGPETLEVSWFPVASLPPRMFPPFSSMFIADALEGGSEPKRRQLQMAAPRALALRAIVVLRDLRNRLLGRD